MSTSVCRKIKFSHIPKDGKDGKTPVYETLTKQWIYKDDPTTAQLQASANQLQAVEQVSANAFQEAGAAKTAAATAQQTANGKATVNEAISGVKSQMFEVYDKNGTEMEPISFQLEQTDNGWEMVFSAQKKSSISGVTNPPVGLVLAYARKSDLNALIQRVAAIEKKLGIS